MKKYIPYTIIVVLLVVIFVMARNSKPTVVERRTSDTTTIYVIDTVFCEKPVYVSEKVLDTIFIDKVMDNAFKLPITQRLYSTDNYQAWISGYQPNLDSIRIFTNTRYSNITSTVSKMVKSQSTDIYLNVGSLVIKDCISPNIGTTVSFKNGLTIGAMAGYYDKSFYYGMNFGYKLNR